MTYNTCKYMYNEFASIIIAKRTIQDLPYVNKLEIKEFLGIKRACNLPKRDVRFILLK